MKEKTLAKYWEAILYPENMVEDWQDKISELLQVPFAYCIHDKCTTSKNGEDRKVHVHIITAYKNTTTENHAFKVFNRLSKPEKCAIPNKHIQPCIDIRKCYDYLIHDTDDSRKKGKYQYPKEERITGNDFDIGNYEQVSQKDKDDMAKELCDIIIDEGIINFADFYMYTVSNFDSKYFEVIKCYSGLFERVINGVWKRNKNSIT